MWTHRRSWDPGTWQARTDRPRVLVEDLDEAVLAVSQSFLEREDFDVQVCSGPHGRHECPLLNGEGCALVAGADLVYTTLPYTGARGSQIVTALRRRYPSTPVVAEIPRPKEEELAGVLEGCHVTYVPCGQQQMKNAILDALPVREPDGF